MPPPQARRRRRRRTSRPQLAAREAFEAAFEKITGLQARSQTESVAAEYLPRFVAELRKKGYRQDDIVTTIVALDLGVTERQIRAADKAYIKTQRSSTNASTNGRTNTTQTTTQSVGGSSATTTSASASSSAATTSATSSHSTHAGLTGSEVLRRAPQS